MMSTKEEAARQIYKAIIKKKEVAYITKSWKIIALIVQFMPEFVLKRI